MAVGLAAAVANAILEAYCNGTDYTGNTEFWVKLHLGDPGAAGASNAAAETDRIQASFGSAASGAITNDAALEWTAVAATESITHVSFWTASAAGTFVGSDALAATKSVDAGDDLTIAIGELDLSITPLAA